MLTFVGKHALLLTYFLSTSAQGMHAQPTTDEENEEPVYVQDTQQDPQIQNHTTSSPQRINPSNLQTIKQPWRAYQLFDLNWFQFGLEQRTRFENLTNDFRANHQGNSTGLLLRTLLTIQLKFPPLQVYTEWIDARPFVSQATPILIPIADPIDILQGYVALSGKHVILKDDAISLMVGRMTIDLGSRRLIARNGFRNTINAFTGIKTKWTSPKQDTFEALINIPIIRQPMEEQAQRTNQISFNRENFNTVLGAFFLQSRSLVTQTKLETYIVGLYEQDSPERPSLNRHIYTPGIRLMRASMLNHFDWDMEIMGQFGRSRATLLPSDTKNLSHLAFALHASLGYQSDVWGQPRIMIGYDYASGGQLVQQGLNHRFDPLFSSRRFEFGPTSFYGSITRSNINSPTVRLELQPQNQLDTFIAYRLVWLAAKQDAWVAAGVQDETGASGNFVGQQIEIRVRWHLLPDNVSFDMGSAVFLRGEFAQNAPNGRKTTPFFVYTQVTCKL